MTSVLALAWYIFTPKPRNAIHLFIFMISLLIVIPSLIASAATGEYRYFEMQEIRNLLRICWFGVAVGFLGFALYYLSNFLHAWGLPIYRIGEIADNWCIYLRRLLINFWVDAR